MGTVGEGVGMGVVVVLGGRITVVVVMIMVLGRMLELEVVTLHHIVRVVVGLVVVVVPIIRAPVVVVGTGVDEVPITTPRRATILQSPG